MTLATTRTGLKTRLETINKLKVFDRAPDSINQLPAAVIVPISGSYNYAMNMGILYEFEVTVLVSRADAASGQKELDDYIDRSGAKSIYAAIDGDTTLGGVCSESIVREFRDYGGFTYGGTVYLGVKFIITIFSG